MEQPEKILKKWYTPLHGIGEIAELQIVEAMKEYAKEACMEALKNAQEKLDDWSDSQYEIHPPMDMIINQSNIPEL